MTLVKVNSSFMSSQKIIEEILALNYVIKNINERGNKLLKTLNIIFINRRANLTNALQNGERK